jgi:hypothetical protein
MVAKYAIFFSSLLGKISCNVLQIGEVADFGAQNSQYTTKVDAW